MENEIDRALVQKCITQFHADFNDLPKEDNPFCNEDIDGKWDVLYDIIRGNLKDNNFDTFDAIETAAAELVYEVSLQGFKAGISFAKQLLK